MIIKICGMRDAQNIREVEALRPTMMGFICWEKSPRYVAQAPSYLPSCIHVGVFVNPTLEYVSLMARLLRLDRLQLHGTESPAFCQMAVRATGLPLIKAIPVRTREDIDAYLPYVGIADMLLFDTPGPQVGGSGQHFDWDTLHHYAGPVPFLLAGGIGPSDASRVRQFRHPLFLGIDVNSRFETAPAQKDAHLLKTFIEQLRA
ncbi:MAG: phosphoribosylanthranilate isomerase [Bacteroidaceae bacterium]|nr:phosphoribosylanthranilate isomerase [Bacteroidaceae bacterium]